MHRIKKVPNWLVKFKVLPPTVSFALNPYIFLSSKLYEDYEAGSPNYLTQAMIAHESVHVQREQAIGLWKFLFKYTFSKKFCLQEEVTAIKEEMRIYKSNGQQFNIKRRAHSLSSFWLYHHCVTFEDAEEILTTLWDQM